MRKRFHMLKMGLKIAQKTRKCGKKAARPYPVKGFINPIAGRAAFAIVPPLSKNSRGP
jgi:hypothetical protein